MGRLWLLFLFCVPALFAGKPTPRPTRTPTLQPTLPGAGWLVVNTYEGVGCSGTPFNVTGNVLNVCSSLFRRGQVAGSYLFSNCVTMTSALYQEFASSDCTGKATVQTQFSGGCSRVADANSNDFFYVSAVNCVYTGLSAIPTLPPNMVVQSFFADCTKTTQQAVAFSAQSTLKCNMNQLNNPFTQLYALSSTFSCDAMGNPGTVGYLGTHCSKTSITTALSQSCAALPVWSSSKFASAASFSCSPVADPVKPTGWLTSTFYSNGDCSGEVLSVSGQATGVCTKGYNNISAIAQSSMTTCEGGTLVYNSPDCSGASVASQHVFMEQGSCQPNSGGFGLRFGGSGASYQVGCSAYDSIPMPYNGHSITLQQYNNDLCSGYATIFSKLPQDRPYSGGNGRYEQLVSCASGSPMLKISLAGSATSTFTLQLDHSCSYMDQAYSTALSASGRRSAANPLGLAYWSSQLYTACESQPPSLSTAPATSTASASESNPPGPGLSGTALAAIVLGLLLAIVLAAGAWIKWRYSVESNGTSTGTHPHLHHKGNTPSNGLGGYARPDAGVPLNSHTSSNPMHAGLGVEDDYDRVAI